MLTTVRSLVGRALRRSGLLGRTPYEPRPRPLTRRTPPLAVPFPAPVVQAAMPRIAVVAHMFHTDLTKEFRGYFAHIPGSPDLYLSTDTEAKAGMVARDFAGWRGGVTIEVVPNVGRDMAPKFVSFAQVYPRYDAVLCVHSKKSGYLGTGEDWRALLLGTLCGSPDTVASILTLLMPDTGVGLVFPDHYPGITDRLSWGGNRATAGVLAARAGIPIDRARGLDFVSGSMFWARPAALAPLLALNLGYDDFPPEEGQLDATTAHALERLLLLSAESAGLDWLRIADRRFLRGDAIEVKGDLTAAIARSRMRLIPH